jgi:hypothetical protein
MSLLLPKSMMAQRIQEKDDAAAKSIASTAVHRMDSDDFLTPDDVMTQLDELQDYVDRRRVDDPGYQLPQPSGWKLMVLVLTIPEKSAGGVIVIDDAKEARALSSPQGVVLDMGPAAYTDAERFSINGVMSPWHGIGDRLTFVKYDASMFQLANGQRLGFLNDTQPISTIDKGWRSAP